jgi:hypothetical protein
MLIISQSTHNGQTLTREILALSVATEWNTARREWDLSHIYFSDPDEPGTCLCGHTPIREHCVLTNRINGNIAIVGNVCVKRFLGLDADELFNAFRRIIKTSEAALGTKAVDYAFDQAWINTWERDFLHSTARKTRRGLSSKQLAIRVRINTSIVRRLTAGGGR